MSVHIWPYGVNNRSRTTTITTIREKKSKTKVWEIRFEYRHDDIMTYYLLRNYYYCFIIVQQEECGGLACSRKQSRSQEPTPTKWFLVPLI